MFHLQFIHNITPCLFSVLPLLAKMQVHSLAKVDSSVLKLLHYDFL